MNPLPRSPFLRIPPNLRLIQRREAKLLIENRYGVWKVSAG
jgi:hypothetical protein